MSKYTKGLRIVGSNSPVDLTERKSVLVNNKSEVVTIEDINGANRWKRYEAILSGEAVILNDGGIQTGNTCYIAAYSPGDDFTNIGASDNLTGTCFVATGDTPTEWSNGSTIYDLTASIVRDLFVLNADEPDYLGDIYWILANGTLSGVLSDTRVPECAFVNGDSIDNPLAFNPNMSFFELPPSGGAMYSLQYEGNRVDIFQAQEGSIASITNFHISIRVRQYAVSPNLIKAETDIWGSKIILTFDKPMYNYRGTEDNVLSGFSVLYQQAPCPWITGVWGRGEDPYTIEFNTIESPFLLITDGNFSILFSEYSEEYALYSEDYGIIHSINETPIAYKVVEPPTIMAFTTNIDGTEVILTFDKDMAPYYMQSQVGLGFYIDDRGVVFPTMRNGEDRTQLIFSGFSEPIYSTTTVSVTRGGESIVHVISSPIISKDGGLLGVLYEDVINISEVEPIVGVVLTFDDITNADLLVGDSSDVGDWNLAFNLPTNGTPFTSAVVVGDIVTLVGGADISMPNELFGTTAPDGADTHLVSIVDMEGAIVELGDVCFGIYTEGGGTSTLTAVDLPAVTSAGTACFALCEALEVVIMPSLVSAGESCFSSCSSLAYIEFESLVTAGTSCFGYCDSLISVEADLLATVGEECFKDCTSFVAPYFSSLETIGAGCFYGCTAMTSLHISACTALGTTVGNDDVFASIADITATITVPIALQTCDTGAPDGDLVSFLAGNPLSTVTYV
jgi:hypothetical protein